MKERIVDMTKPLASALHSRWESRPLAVWVTLAAWLSVIAGCIHLLVAPDHFAEWAGYGLFFLVVALAQLWYGWFLTTTGITRGWLVVGIAAHVLLMVLYVYSRTVGIPLFGPHAGEVEPVAFIDIVSKTIEVALIACLVVLWRRPSWVRV